MKARTLVIEKAALLLSTASVDSASHQLLDITQCIPSLLRNLWDR